MTGPTVRLSKRAKGYELRHEDGYQVATLSAIDAAKLLFQLKDELRRTQLGRGCVDRVAEMRRQDAFLEALGRPSSTPSRGRNDP